MSASDPSSLLENTLSSIGNLKKETQFTLSEIRNIDKEFLRLKKFMEEQDVLIQKHIVKNGAIQEHNKETEITAKILESIEKCKELQERKSALANTLLYITTTKYRDLKNGMDLLEAEGLLAPNEVEEIEPQDSIQNVLKQKYQVHLDYVESENDDLNSDGDYLDSDQGSKKRKAVGGSNRTKATSSSTAATKAAIASMKKQKSSSGSSSSKKQKLDSELQGSAGSSTKTSRGRSVEPALSNTQEDEEDDDKQLYCFCQNVSYGEMVACDGDDCKYEWFHYACVNLTEPPKGKWYCPDCKAK